MMRYTRGEYTTTEKYFGVLMGHSKHECEIVLIESGQVYSAFKKTEDGKEFGFLKADAKKLFQVIDKALKKCKSKNGQPMPFVLGSSMMHSFTLAKGEFNFEIFDGSIVGAEVYLPDNKRLTLEYTDQDSISGLNIPYIPLTVATPKKTSGTADDSNLQEANEADEVVVRSVAEIAMEKEDISWLKNKKYYIVNDDDYAEQIFSAIEKLDTEVSYDTETTGLRINCFSKVNSSYEAQLAEWNNSHSKDEQIRADRLVGIIFSVEENVSYYFPVFNRKFKNLYTTDSASRKKAVDMIYERYRDEEFCKRHPDMADYFHKTPSSQWRSDVILMERVRFILEYLHIVAHNGSFEWKVSWCYEICLNLQDDTMIMHQIMYKFRSTTSNKGEPSNLKYLSKVELGIDQWELSDFFPDYADDDSGLAISNKKSRKKKKNSKIDFSYMTYEGTRVYAPTDGDATLLLCHKYKKDLLENHREQEYLYNVEIIVACCIAYMEFYGIRIDEEKIYGIRDQTKAEIACIESEIRQKVGYSGEKELEAYNSLKAAMEEFNRADQAGDSGARKLANENTLKHVDSLYKAIAEDEEHVLNLASPAQVATLFYDVLGYPFQGEKKSVAKKEIKPLLKMKNEDGSPMYPVANMYSDYKAKDTLMTKFFDNLPYFMYPGGLVFAHFGQISTATGRMSCNKPNLQQMPKAITKIMCPRPGNIMIDADYSQIEYRVLTALAENEGLLKLFSDPDSDYHTLMASLMYGVDYAAVTPKMRSDAKSFNFGIPYGMGIKSLAILLTGNSKPSSVAEAKEKYELYFKNQPKTRQFFDNVKEMANVRGYTKTHWNRYRYYSFTNPDGTQNNARKAAALRQAGNAIIQGCLGGVTLIHTKEYGIVQIQDVVDQHLHVWDGEKWSGGDILYSGKKRKCIVTFGTGQMFICSPTHKFLVKSAKGNERFVECQNLRGRNVSTNPHRVVINKHYQPSDYTYSSADAARMFATNNHESRNVFLEDIGDSFKIGVVLGRLASDGSVFNRAVGGSSIRQIVAEHEESVRDILKDYMSPLDVKCTINKVRKDRNERLDWLEVYSQSLVDEIDSLDIKHTVNKNIFMDTEVLRGFLRGFFDGDGGISGQTITLAFGTQADFEPMCRDIQKALLFLGIRSRYYKYGYRSKITISTYDNQKFLDLVGFVNPEKQEAGRKLSCVRDEHIFGQVVSVESVEITDEYIDMYDVCNTDGGYYVADGLITHNTAADIFKISVARNYMYIKENWLFGKLFIVNMIHDEQLFEVNPSVLNSLRVLADIGRNMQFKLEGFPPLFIGAGVGKAWGEAKGKMAEIHPMLLDEFMKEAESLPLYNPEGTKCNPADVIKYFSDRVYEFRRQKVIAYLTNPDNFGKEVHPAIGNLLNLQFTYGHDKGKEGLDDKAFTNLCIDEFIKHNNLTGIDSSMFIAKEESKDVEEDKEYEDDEDSLDSLEDMEIDDSIFTVVDESDVAYGVSIQDLIKNFKFFVSEKYGVCGIDAHDLSYQTKDNLITFLVNHMCDENSKGAMELVFLQSGNILKHTGCYVSNITNSDIEEHVE